MQEQMQRLQQQLEASQNLSTSSATPAKTAKNSTGPKLIQVKTAAATKKTNTQAGKHFVVHQSEYQEASITKWSLTYSDLTYQGYQGKSGLTNS